MPSLADCLKKLTAGKGEGGLLATGARRNAGKALKPRGFFVPWVDGIAAKVKAETGKLWKEPDKSGSVSAAQLRAERKFVAEALAAVEKNLAALRAAPVLETKNPAPNVEDRVPPADAGQARDAEGNAGSAPEKDLSPGTSEGEANPAVVATPASGIGSTVEGGLTEDSPLQGKVKEGDSTPAAVLDGPAARIARFLDNDDSASALSEFKALKKDEINKVAHEVTGAGFYNKTKQQMLEELTDRLPRLTASSLRSATKDRTIKSARKAVEEMESKQQRHLQGYLGPPMVDYIPEELARDPHGAGREAVAAAWAREVEAARSKLAALEGQAEPAPDTNKVFTREEEKPVAKKSPKEPAPATSDYGPEYAALEKQLAEMKLLEKVRKMRADGVTDWSKFPKVKKIVAQMQRIEEEARGDDGYTWTPDDDDPTDSAGAAIAGSTGGALLHPSTAPSVPVVSIKSQSQIIRDLAKGLELPIRFGRLTTNKFAGYFKKVQNLIGAKRANDIPTVAHEVGHKLDELFDLSSNRALIRELDVLGDPATPGSSSSWTNSKPRSYKMGEGVGEFVRYWLTEPSEATRMAPLTEAHFNAILDANPDFGDVMRQAREDIQNWKNAPEEARLDSSISIGGNPNKTRYRLPQLTRDLVDDLHILSLAVDDARRLGTDIKPSENFYMNARLLRGSHGMAGTFIQRGVVDFKTKDVTLGASFEDALKPVAGKIDAFRRWMVAKRAQELHAQGRETGLVRADVDAVAAKYEKNAAFQTAFTKLKEWQDSLLQYAVDAGYVDEGSPATATEPATGAYAMREMNKDYVPFHRVFEIGAGESPSQESSGLGRGLNVGKVSSLKRLTGSTRDIVDPLETMIRNAYAIVTASEKSAISAQIGAMANKPGMGKWVEEVAAPKESVKVELERIRKQLEDAGADLTGVPDDLVATFFQSSFQAPWGENIIKSTTRGKTGFFRLRSELYDAFHALDLDDSSRLIQILSSPAQVLRAGVTLDPAFGGANLIRDAFGSAVMNRYGLLPFQAAIKGVAALMKNPNIVAEWSAAGGEQTFEASYFDQKKLARFLREKITKDLTPRERALMWVKSPLLALRWFSGQMEAVTRIGEFKTAYEAAKAGGMTDGDARRQAAFESRDRQDFAMGGAKTKIFRHAAAFWNAGLQSNVALYKAFKDRPVRTTLQGLAYITVPTMALMAVNHDDEDYWDRPQWERDVFWLIPIGKDANGHTEFMRVPKPFVLGTIFGALPERIAASQKGKKEAFRELGDRLKENTVPNPTPNAFLWLFETNAGAGGYSFFRGKPIVPESLQNLPPEFQMTEQTSETAKKAGKLLGISPMKVDYFISSTTGGLGKQVVHNAIDRTISAITGEKKTAQNMNPAARFFATPAGISSQAVDDFYRQITALREKKAGEKLGGEKLTPPDRALLGRMEQAADRMTEHRKAARKLTDPTAKQKLYLRISKEAKSFTYPSPN